MKKKHKQTAHRRPPLSALDQSVYLLLSLAICGICAGYTYGWVRLSWYIVYMDSAVIVADKHAGYLFLIPFWFFCVLGMLAPLLHAFYKHKPLFGNKQVRYGQSPWKTDTYPMFGSQHKSFRRSPKAVQKTKLCRWLWFLGFLLVCLLPLLGISGRTCLKNDFSIEKYDALNRKTACYTLPEDCTNITIFSEADHSLRRVTWRTDYWAYGMRVHLKNGEEIELNSRQLSTKEGTTTSLIDALLYLKQGFSASQIRIEGTEYVEQVIIYYEMDEKEEDLLRALFR